MDNHAMAPNTTSIRKFLPDDPNGRELDNMTTDQYFSLFDKMGQGFCIIEVLFDKNDKPYDYRFLKVNAVFEKQTGLKDATGRTDTKNAALVAKLSKQVDRLTRLITDLLDTTRIEEVGLLYQHEVFSMNTFLKERVDEIRHLSGKRSIILDLEEPSFVNADKERIGQVISNLIINAIKYSPDNTLIEVDTRSEDDHIRVSVTDQGIGIPEESLPKIFDRFYRVKGQSMSTYPGIGLGLYISSEIIKSHGGSIFVSSKEGEGSAFSFKLPLLKK